MKQRGYGGSSEVLSMNINIRLAFEKRAKPKIAQKKKIIIKKGIYTFSCLNLESLLPYFKQARECKLQSVWIEKNLYKCFVQAQKGKRV